MIRRSKERVLTAELTAGFYFFSKGLTAYFFLHFLHFCSFHFSTVGSRFTFLIFTFDFFWFSLLFTFNLLTFTLLPAFYFRYYFNGRVYFFTYVIFIFGFCLHFCLFWTPQLFVGTFLLFYCNCIFVRYSVINYSYWRWTQMKEGKASYFNNDNIYDHNGDVNNWEHEDHPTYRGPWKVTLYH